MTKFCLEKKEKVLSKATHNFEKNLESLRVAEVKIPYGFFLNIQEGKKFYEESIYCYLLGLPDAAVTIIMGKCLEIGLKQKYRIEEKKEPPKKGPEKNLSGLINWAKPYLGTWKDLAQGFAILRNLIHEEKEVESPAALEAIRYISKILDILFPVRSGEMDIFIQCEKCREEIHCAGYEQFSIGTPKKTIECKNCGSSNECLIFPSVCPDPLSTFTWQQRVV